MIKKVAVVILNWNGKKFLEDLLPTLIKHTPTDVNIVVGDNASTDGSVEFLQQNHLMCGKILEILYVYCVENIKYWKPEYWKSFNKIIISKKTTLRIQKGKCLRKVCIPPQIYIHIY